MQSLKKKCVSPYASVLALANDIIKERPACVDVKPVTDVVVDKVTTGLNDATKLSTALEAYKSDLDAAGTVIDATTGANFAKDFNSVVLAIVSPVKNSDGSLKLTALVAFIPTGDVVKLLTEDHKRIYCPIIKRLLASLAGFKEIDLTDCAWSDQTSVKRQLPGETGVDNKAISTNVEPGAVAALQSTAHQQTISFFLVVLLVIMSLFLF